MIDPRANFPRCAHADAELAARLAENGHRQVGYHCPACDAFVKLPGQAGIWLDQRALVARGIDVAALTVVIDAQTRRLCYHCGMVAPCELHHCAPREYFGDDADRWPMVWACTACHNAYHEALGRTIRRVSTS